MRERNDNGLRRPAPPPAPEQAAALCAEDLRLAREASELRQKHGGHWGEYPGDPVRSVKDWMFAVANDDTRFGYWEWVATSLEGG